MAFQVIRPLHWAVWGLYGFFFFVFFFALELWEILVYHGSEPLFGLQVSFPVLRLLSLCEFCFPLGCQLAF